MREELADTFLRGLGITAKRLTEVRGDPTYKRFSRMQKRKIMGQCGVNMWDELVHMERI